MQQLCIMKCSKMMQYYVAVLIMIIALKSISCLQCLDENKNPVDWYVIYKLPLQKHDNPLIEQGAAYAYMTAANAGEWVLSQKSINDTNSFVGVTLSPLFAENDTIHILYNDQTPIGKVAFKKGHTKGFVLGDQDGGIWTVHSVPHFPPIDAGKYYYPHNGYENGQNFLCISFTLENFDQIGLQLQYNQPEIYWQNIPEKLKPKLPKLSDVINNITIQSAPWYHLANLTSRAGANFLSFAKSRLFAKDLYEDWVAAALSTNLLVETWPNSPGRLPSDCSKPYKVKNIKSISMNVTNLTFKTTTDHSKWAVANTTTQTAMWICIGDINRAAGQKHRGGGTVCFNNSNVATAYQKIVGEIETC